MRQWWKKRQAVEPLITRLETGSTADLRQGAAEALGKLGDARAVEPLIAALNDTATPVRQSAAEALVRLGAPQAVDPLTIALKDETASDGLFSVPVLAAEVLGRLGDGRAVAPLIAALNDERTYLSGAASRALVALGDVGVEPLVAALNGEDFHLHTGAASALGTLGDARAVEPLIRILGKGIWQSASAGWALGELGDARAVEPLIVALKTEHEFVRANAAQALGHLGRERRSNPSPLSSRTGPTECARAQRRHWKVSAALQRSGHWRSTARCSGRLLSRRRWQHSWRCTTRAPAEKDSYETRSAPNPFRKSASGWIGWAGSS